MKNENEERFICPFPNCGKTFWKADGEANCCPYHRQLIKDVLYILNKTRTVQVAGSGPLLGPSGQPIRKGVP